MPETAPKTEPTPKETSKPKPRQTFQQKLFAFSTSGAVKLVLACLAVGVVLAILDIDPTRIWSDFLGTIADAWTKGWELAGGAVDYLFLGAILVIPVFMIFRIVHAVRR